MRLWRVSRLGPILAVSCIATAARADAPTRANSPAETAFREGRALMAAGALEEACAKLAESQRLEPAAGTLLNLAECLEKRGLTASAWAFYRSAITASAKRGRQDWEKLATSKAEKLGRIAPRVTYDVQPSDLEAGVALTQDGAPALANVAIPVDPGSHTVEAKLDGREPWRQSFEIRNGDRLHFTVSLPGAASPAADASMPPPPPTTEATGQLGGPQVVGIGLAGAGVLGIALGTYAGLTAISKHGDAVEMCASYPDRCPSDGSATRINDDASRFATISTIGFVAGGALIAGGAVLFFATTPKQARLRVSPAVARERALLMFDGRF